MPPKKIIIISLIVLIIILLISAVFYRSIKSEKNEVQRQAQEMLNRNGEFNSQNTQAQIAELKEALLYLAQEVGENRGDLTVADSEISGLDRVSSPNINGSYSTTADLLLRIRTLEDKVAQLEGDDSTTTSSSASGNSTKVQYIPLGSGAEVTDSNGTTLPQYEITLDPADFPGYTSIQLEAVVRMAEVTGTLSLNFYNYTDKQSITNSDISTNSTSFITANSFNFRLASGRKTYRIWAKSSAGLITYIQSARLKINY